jgi:hypothetical protein
MIAPDGGGGKSLLRGIWRGNRSTKTMRFRANAHGRGTGATFATAGITASLGES